MLKKTNTGIDPSIRSKRQELKLLDEMITERTQYHRTQEQLIKDMVHSGNTVLMELNHEILVARRDLKELKTDIRTARQDKRLIEGDLELIRQDIANATESVSGQLLSSPALG